MAFLSSFPNELRLGLRVIASARRTEVLADLRALGIDTISLDVTDTAAIGAAKTEVHSLTGGKLDILVNNAYVFWINGCYISDRSQSPSGKCTRPCMHGPPWELTKPFDSLFRPRYRRDSRGGTISLHDQSV
jgi:NAD(P)-dependent dehydrogenase (short-subunit alcohol dehydrogenase family)